MTRTYRKAIGLNIILGMLVATAAAKSVKAADIYTFSVLPSDGQIAGLSGAMIGWGYSITNESTTNWLVTSSLNADPFLFASVVPIFDFPDIAPGATVSEFFDASSEAGLYQLTWDSNAPPDFANFGSFTLSAQWWSDDPLAGGQFISDAPDSVQPYFAMVSEASSVPEPSTQDTSIVLAVGLTLSRIIRGNRFGGEQE